MRYGWAVQASVVAKPERMISTSHAPLVAISLLLAMVRYGGVLRVPPLFFAIWPADPYRVMRC
ncbi:hypothetical protein DIE22_02210 [Burkholderia sp. Bp9142]|nr:hypothetical protein DIE22_02210 [Burkholderia sp. Bp9142]RQR49266.1 hypothetical protein DIE21_20270 [Burkholderia sp. Bp9140]